MIDITGPGISRIPNMVRMVFKSLAKNPTVSNEFAYATTPHLETSPYEGLNPKIPL